MSKNRMPPSSFKIYYEDILTQVDTTTNKSPESRSKIQFTGSDLLLNQLKTIKNNLKTYNQFNIYTDGSLQKVIYKEKKNQNYNHETDFDRQIEIGIQIETISSTKVPLKEHFLSKVTGLPSSSTRAELFAIFITLTLLSPQVKYKRIAILKRYK